MNGNDAFSDEDRYQQEVMDQMRREYDDYQCSQEALPPHKRDGYAERMYEQADMRRKELRENQ